MQFSTIIDLSSSSNSCLLSNAARYQIYIDSLKRDFSSNHLLDKIIRAKLKISLSIT